MFLYYKNYSIIRQKWYVPFTYFIQNDTIQEVSKDKNIKKQKSDIIWLLPNETESIYFVAI